MYVGCYVTWAAKLQTEVALRTTEDEFIAMSEGLRIVTQLMRFIEEMVEKRVKRLDSWTKDDRFSTESISN